MQALQRRFSQSLISKISWICSHERTLTTHISSSSSSSLHPLTNSSNKFPPRGTLVAPWFAIQHRGAKVLGSDVRFGNVIQRKGRIYQVLKSQHTQQGRGGATIQVELRDVVTGNKVTERFRTDEAMEKVFVEDKSFTFLYSEGDSVTVMEPDTFEQIEISKELFGKAAAYLKEQESGNHILVLLLSGLSCGPWLVKELVDSLLHTCLWLPQPLCSEFGLPIESCGAFSLSAIDPFREICYDMKVSLQMYDGKIMSASIPTRVTCTVSEAKSHVKGLTATPQYKRVLLDNGITVLVPPFIEAGDEIIINTTDDSYITRAKE